MLFLKVVTVVVKQQLYLQKSELILSESTAALTPIRQCPPVATRDPIGEGEHGRLPTAAVLVSLVVPAVPGSPRILPESRTAAARARIPDVRRAMTRDCGALRLRYQM